MRYFIDSDLSIFLEENIEAVIELLKKAYESTKKHYKDNAVDDFLYWNANFTFTHGYCFYFARMLKSIYRHAKFVVADRKYAHIAHIYLYVNGYMYDVTGKRKLDNYFVLTTKELNKINVNHARLKPEIYETFKEYFYLYLKQYVQYNNFCIKNTKKLKLR